MTSKLRAINILVSLITPVITILGTIYVFNIEIGKSNKVLVAYVVDEDSGQPIQGALVRLITRDDIESAAITNDFGQAEIPYEKSGSSRVIISSFKFNTLEKPIELSQQNNSKVFYLFEKTIISIQ